MPVEHTAIDGLLVVRWDVHADERGFFQQTFQTSELEAALGREVVLRQGNHSRSGPGVVRGFHAEPWDKLVQVVRGTALAAVADLRPDSPTFGEVATFLLGDPPGERLRLFVAEGLGNAFGVVGAGEADYLYEVTAEYRPGGDRLGVRWDDRDLGVDWPVDVPTLSRQDRANPTLRERFPDHPRWT